MTLNVCSLVMAMRIADMLIGLFLSDFFLVDCTSETSTVFHLYISHTHCILSFQHCLYDSWVLL